MKGIAMNKSKTSLQNTCSIMVFYVFLLIFFTPVIALAQDDKNQIQEKIAQIDADLTHARNRMLQIQNNRETIANFSEQAFVWFDKLTRNKMRIKELKAKVRNNLEANPINIEIRELGQKQKNILQLNGRSIKGYSGRTLKSINELRSEFNNTAYTASELNVEYKRLVKSVHTLNMTRDNLVVQLGTDNNALQTRLTGYKNDIDGLEETYSELQKLINREDVWCLPLYGDLLGVNILPRKVLIKIIAEKYFKHAEKPYNPSELASRIKKAEVESDLAKKLLKNKGLPGIEQKIVELKQKISSIQSQLNEFNLAGCWLLTLGRYTSQIDISQYGQGRYRGILTRKNKLRHYRQGQKVLEISHQSKSGNVYKGFDHSYNDEGSKVVNPLTITVHSNGNFLTYRTIEKDGPSSIQLHRCP